jgi:ketosteroid isomerase-like protein
MSETQKRFLVLSLLVLALLIAVNPAMAQGSTPEKTREGIYHSSDAMKQALRDRDVDLLLSYFTSDCQLCGMGQPPVEGHKQVRSQIEYLVSRMFTGLETHIDEIHGDNKTAVEIGENFFYDSNEQLISRSRYITIWKNEKGKWKIYRTMTNPSS